MTRRRILIAAVLTLWCWGCEFTCAATLKPNGPAKDDTQPLLDALGRDNVVTLAEGEYELDYKKLKNRPELARFTLIGAAPATAWPQRHPNQKNYATRLIFKNVPAHEWLLDWVTPKDQMAGPQQLINLDIYRDTPGNGFRFRGEEEFNLIREPARGLLIRDCSFSSSDQHQWTRAFKGGELPDIHGTAIELHGQHDARLEGVSAWNFENQVIADKCDRLRIRDFHGGNCARSIQVVDGIVPAHIDGAHIENVIVSGIDVTYAQVTNSNVEVGYWTSVGPSTLPKELTWQLHAGWGVVSTEGPDLKKWLPERSVVRLAGNLLYVNEVESAELNGKHLGWFTFYLWNSHCRLPDLKGDGEDITRLLGIPYIARGDTVTIQNWTPNINKAVRHLPAAAFFPFRSPIIAANCNLGIGEWDDSNIAQVGGWHEQQHDFGGSVHVVGPTWLRPDHPWVTGEDYGRLDRNNRWKAK